MVWKRKKKMIKIKSVSNIISKKRSDNYSSYNSILHNLGKMVPEIWKKTDECINFIKKIEYYD